MITKTGTSTSTTTRTTSTHDHDHDHDHEELDEEAVAKARERERESLRRYTLSQIRQYPDVALRMKAKEVTQFDDYLTALAERMMQMMEDAQGVGLAATQLGILQRMFVFETEDQGPQAVANPRIVEASDEKETDEEGCLSLEDVRVPVERHVRVISRASIRPGARCASSSRACPPAPCSTRTTISTGC